MMIDQIPRRRVLATLAFQPLLLSGCMNPRERELEFRNVTVVSASDPVTITGSVRGEKRNAEKSWATFHEVLVVGYDTNRTIVCTENIGTVSPNSMREFELTCGSLPSRLTLTARETPCDGNTYIDVFEWIEAEENPNIDEDRYLGLRERECNETAFPPSE